MAVVKRHQQEVPNQRKSHSAHSGDVSSRIDLIHLSTEREEVNRRMSYSEWLDFAKAHWRKQEGQTMAEYGVVLGVITIAAVGVFTALSGGINGAVNHVTSILPK